MNAPTSAAIFGHFGIASVQVFDTAKLGRGYLPTAVSIYAEDDLTPEEAEQLAASLIEAARVARAHEASRTAGARQ